ncbi:retinol dehydrogenase 12-like protein [Dinothrombium tinctorium]|uniref:Retinol dehydrogenase 12-like protein n=1 Tax=Dinothrombium tinctorium TaxID=1965070 RepID=A0A443QNX5_9ACAR|nr:retinol dehydrogenase 12-like protein [Dinothrombium tinctorium]RWS04730.1 retinol dehydrogenase 12-like protein [Dinothrombium tinctorium]
MDRIRANFGTRLCSASCTSNARIDGKTVIITGGNTGIGKETAIDLAKRGGKIILACRNAERAEKAVEEIKQASNSQNVQFYLMDLSSLRSVREATERILKNEDKIDILINNAGIMMTPFAKTVDGYESQFATNHLGHFLFTLLLMKRIKETNGAKIINVSSEGHRWSSLNFEDLNSENNYSSLTAYANSKLANILFTRELSRRLVGTDIHVYALHPGFVDTELARSVDSRVFKYFIDFWMKWMAKTAKQGAQTTIYCAVDENAAKETGLYYAECKPTKPSKQALNNETAERLWEKSLEMVGLKNYSEI